MPEEERRGELFGLRATASEHQGCPEHEEEEEEQRGHLDSEWLYQSYRGLPEQEPCAELLGIRPLLNTGACPEE